MRIESLHVYPIKSTAPLDLETATVELWGLADDRRFMVVDAESEQITGREEARLLSVSAMRMDGGWRIRGPHAADLFVADRPTDLVPVTVWDTPVQASTCGPDADSWFAKLLDQDVRLVYLDDPTQRAVDQGYGRPDDRVTFADAYPLLLTSSASLRRLNEWILQTADERGEPTPDPLIMRRFRPSVVVDGEGPFAEERWSRVRLGEVSLRAVKLCDRCVMTTIDPFTLVRGKEPIRTLAKHHGWDGKVWFGVNLIPDGAGTCMWATRSRFWTDAHPSIREPANVLAVPRHWRAS